MSTVLSLADTEPAAVAEQAAGVLASGGLVVVPTDTVYAVVVDPFQPGAAERVFEARGGTRADPLPVLVGTTLQLSALAREVSPQAQRLIDAFWPGPLTLIFPASEALSWDLGDTGGTVAIRQPAEEALRQVIAASGPLACTAAGRAGGPAPTTVGEARVALGDAVELYVDGGVRDGRPSTIVDVSRGGVEVRRRGAISADDVIDVATGDDGGRAERAP
jgi:L-threonylcarbamoyladenylate synthase